MELKFRAWCKEGMIYFDDLYFFEEEMIHKVENGEADGALGIYKIMQYTGLKDKNGKEIYEGDVVKGVGWIDKNEVYIVEFGNGEYYLEAPEGADYEYYNGDCPHGDRVDNWYESEVIGNIHDNPELIGA